MRVNSTVGADPWNPSNPSQADRWSIVDVTSGGTGYFEIYGAGNHWNVTPTTLAPLPSDFQNLLAPSDGIHYFTVSYVGETPEDFILHTEVRCYRVDNGVETLATTTYHSFDLDQGANYTEFGGVFFADFCRNFACLVLSAGEDECEQTGDPGNN